MRAVGALAALIILAACIDSAGPRPRPGGGTDEPLPEQPAALLWYEMQPRVITQGQADSVRITVGVSGTAETVSLETLNGQMIPFARTAPGIYSARIAVALALFGYRTSDLHNTIGFIRVSAHGQTIDYACIANVRDATVPVVAVETLENGVQATARVVNIRYDNLYLGGKIPTTPIRTFFQHFADEYTFIALIEQVQSPHDPFFSAVRNQVRGIGLAQFDNGGEYGSGAALEGVIDYPADAPYDPAETSNIHELAHRWLNYLRLPSLSPARPHWPLSDLALGINGWGDPVTNERLLFPFEVIPLTTGGYQLRSSTGTRSFNDLELYLAGLLPADSVQSHLVFLNQHQRAQVRADGILQGPVDTVTIAEIIAVEGARSPVAGAAPRQFRMATLVLSRGGMLSRDEMSFFDALAARGEQQQALPFYNGLRRGTTLPFYVATNRRATLLTRLGTR